VSARRSLPPLTGHEEIRERLARAADRGRLPQSLLLHGPEGVGKQRLGLWLGRRLLCETGTACGECRACKLALHLEHPDLHWFFPLPRPRGVSGRARLREKLEEARMEELARRRDEPLAPLPEEGATGIYLAAVDEIRSRAARRPAMGRRSVFVVGDAEAMVPQAASQQAANAFLKLLEEPPDDTYLVLTSSRRSALLPTVRSRVLGVRVAPLREEEVADFLVEHAGAEPELARRVARRAHGSIGRGLRSLSGDGSEARELASDLLRAALSGGAAAGYEVAVRIPPAGARGEFSETLAAAVELVRDLLAASLAGEETTFDPEIGRLAGDRVPPPHGLVRSVELLEEARARAHGNVNPQAIAAGLVSELARELRP